MRIFKDSMSRVAVFRNSYTSYIKYKFGLKKEPIIICGRGRSGTTLMLAILSAHLRIFSILFEPMHFAQQDMMMNRIWMRCLE